MKQLQYISIVLGILLLLARCGEPQKKSAEGEHGHHEEEHGGESADRVELTDVQLASIDLEYGTFTSLNVSGFVKANGILDLPPQNIVAITTPMNGMVKKANFLVGDFVKKGTVLAVLEHMDYVKMQEEYLGVLNNLDYLEAEYTRQKTLDSARVTSRKQFQKTASLYRSARAKKQALEKQLRYIGLSPERVAAGHISSTIALRAPISGYITRIAVHNGELARSEQEIYELVDNSHMHIELDVFEQDIRKVKTGQSIQFVVPGIGDGSYQGEVYLTGKSFDMDNKTVKVHGHIEGEHPDFIRGLYLEARIYTGKKEIRALPEDALVEEGGKTFVFVKNGGAVQEQEELHTHTDDEAQETPHGDKHGTAFTRVQVVPGIRDQGFVEIKEIRELPGNAEIVLKGAYYLYSEMKKGEGGHHHH
ncbi:efflux RND transporter periplasmic adaptor subunit [Sinomicrobium kalidii]|uniref:efflux RND transporter periplasmic adaptor subunit n=1 Tax=Sinomicrobium kalidii TaxID=2900738 RepID=UPI001E60B019|nr:efflux RND transporter periplasmic adaptor subunit [Sinomicrobium kalidii]UGU15306.1 efflux RND transporter periplasmic adaptor subunit [Sinomicrobium kalidii]